MSFHMSHFLQLCFQPLKMDIFNFDLINFYNTYDEIYHTVLY